MRVGSLCSGYGGLDMAALDVFGGTVAWHCENDPHASRVLGAHWPEVPNLHDLTAVDWTTVEPVDVLTAGWPCQPFSHAGQRKGSADARHLWPHVADAVRVLRPRYFLGENVSGHLSLGFGRVLFDLSALGYVGRWRCLRASDVGAPHGRNRVFLTAWPATDADFPGSQRPEPAGRRPLPDWRAPADAAGDGRDERRAEPAGIIRGPDASLSGHGTTTDADSGRWDGWSDGANRVRQPAGDGAVVVDWGAYTPAIRRWERILGHPAPAPTEPGRTGQPRLSPAFVEWMQGVPAGWVTDVPIPRNAQLKALGNGVVPQQAAAAYRMLLGLPVAGLGGSGGALLPTPDAGVFNDGESVASWLARRDVQRERHRNGNGMGTPLAMAVRLLDGAR